MNHFYCILPGKMTSESGVLGLFKKKVLKSPGLDDLPASSQIINLLVIKLKQQGLMPPRLPSPTFHCLTSTCLACDWLGGSSRISLFPATYWLLELGAQEPHGALGRRSTDAGSELGQRWKGKAPSGSPGLPWVTQPPAALQSVDSLPWR